MQGRPLQRRTKAGLFRHISLMQGCNNRAQNAHHPRGIPRPPLTMVSAPRRSESHTRLPAVVSWLRPMARLPAPTSGAAREPTTWVARASRGAR
jgi:hypothetical protein